MSDGTELGTDLTEEAVASGSSISDVVESAGIEDVISTAKLGYENFGKNKAGSTAFGWVVADSLATELEARIAAAAEPQEDSVADSDAAVHALSEWIDGELSDRDAEAVTLHRIFKLQEEAGEVASATIGALGANPRKGVTNDTEKIKDELLDVAVTALGAYDHLDGEGRAVSELLEKIRAVAVRAGVIEEDPTEGQD